ncbi:hypothetical protein J4429_01440 [Candidatus Pacearchaeota archaeon]|nr:hypothetical protein [Candidatus Pacearchaeota archaeon]
MIKITIEDIVFWIFILIIIGTALWLLHGSPPEMDAIIAIGIAVAGSELLIWKTIFNNHKKTSLKLSEMDKKTALSFLKIKNEMNNRFDKIEEKLNLINNKLKR